MHGNYLETTTCWHFGCKYATIYIILVVLASTSFNQSRAARTIAPHRKQVTVPDAARKVRAKDKEEVEVEVEGYAYAYAYAYESVIDYALHT